MPGILPMKIIKVGTIPQSRIAQACDRCRSKKIRCDGITPYCSQCKNVGFECKTSDKLSRRAFPRGYTESLEERVRTLEAEVRELKDLLDEKDEKIDLLSKVQSFSPRKSSTSPSAPDHSTSTTQEPCNDTFKVYQTPNLQKSEHKSDPFFVGTSSTRVFIDTIRSKIREKGSAVSNFDTTALIGRCDLAKPAKQANLSNNISRLASDQLVNVFFQEWGPLLPILHRPTFLKIYTNYNDDIGSVKDAASIAQLNLVFGIAALANESSKELLPSFEAQWQGAVGAIINDPKISTLQCLVLAQLYCIVRGDSNKLVYYSGVAVNMSRRLGLHQSQKRFTLGALTRETRKKVFWSLYTLEVFGAMSLGLPKLLKDDDVETEEPADIDDENVNERGFQSTSPGESTKLSSALALFRLARVLSRVQTELYPAASTYELSLQKVGALSNEVDEWRNNLAPHLRLEFAKDKPSTNVISSRCPLLGLFYYYVRMLIHRPVLHADISTQSNSSILAVAESSKHIIQILQLLQERSLSYTVCINKSELIISCGFGLMYQVSDLSSDSKLRKDTQQFITACVDLLEHSGATAVISFRKIAKLFVPQPEFAIPARNGRSSGDVSPKSSKGLSKSTKGQLQAIAARFTFPGTRSSKPRTQSTKSDQLPFKSEYLGGSDDSFTYNASTTILPLSFRERNAQADLSSISSEPTLKHRMSTPTISLGCELKRTTPNLDYLPLGTLDSVPSSMDVKPLATHGVADWDGLLKSLDSVDVPPCDQSLPADTSPQCAVRHTSDASFVTPPVPIDWNIEWNTPDGWSLFDLDPPEQPFSAKSVLSFDDESTSGEDLSSCDMGSEIRGYSISNEDYYSLPKKSSLSLSTTPTKA